MRRAFILYLIVVCSAILASCGKQFDDGYCAADMMYSDVPITFGTGLSVTTKGTDPYGNQDDLNTLPLSDLGVYAGFSLENTTDISTVDCTANLANAKFVRNGTDWIWRGSPNRYWPMKGYLSIFAYAPYAEEGLSKVEDYSSGMPAVYFSPRTDMVRKQTDFVISKPVYWKDKSVSDTVSLEFSHAVTCVNFVANYIGELPAPNTYMYIDSLKVKGLVGKAKLQWKDESPYYEWDLTGFGADSTYTMSVKNLEIVDQPVPHWTDYPDNRDAEDKWLNIGGVNGRMYLVPQTLSSDASIEIYWSMCTRYGSSKVVLSRFLTESRLPAGDVWNAGEFFYYYMTINLKEFSSLILNTSITDWVESGNQTDPGSAEPDHKLLF